jgi:hypothetical protein
MARRTLKKPEVPHLAAALQAAFVQNVQATVNVSSSRFAPEDCISAKCEIVVSGQAVKMNLKSNHGTVRRNILIAYAGGDTLTLTCLNLSGVKGMSEDLIESAVTQMEAA